MNNIPISFIKSEISRCLSNEAESRSYREALEKLLVNAARGTDQAPITIPKQEVAVAEPAPVTIPKQEVAAADPAPVTNPKQEVAGADPAPAKTTKQEAAAANPAPVKTTKQKAAAADQPEPRWKQLGDILITIMCYGGAWRFGDLRKRSAALPGMQVTESTLRYTLTKDDRFDKTPDGLFCLSPQGLAEAKQYCTEDEELNS